jgi:hypothetical protein
VAALFSFMEPLRLGALLGIGSVAVTATLIPGWRGWIPQRRRQVTKSIIVVTTRARTGFRWGVDLGFGIRTSIVTPALYALLVLAVANGPLDALVVCLTYGASRGAVILALSHRRARSSRLEEDGEPGHGLETSLRLPIVAVFCLAAGLTIA